MLNHLMSPSLAGFKMTAECSCNNNPEQSQAYLHRGTDLPSGYSEDNAVVVADLAADEAAKTQIKSIQLNQSTIGDLEQFVKDDPTADLWLCLREASRTYKAERAKHTDKPAIASKASTPESEDRFNHIIHPEADISVLWPLAPSLATLLHKPSLSTGVPFQGTQQTAVSRSALSALLNSGELLFHLLQRAIVRIAPDIVVKIGRSQDVTEVSNPQHIRMASSTIPVPTPLGMLSIARKTYVFTSFVPGIPLDRMWANLTFVQKANIQQQLNTIFTELRNLPIPSKDGYFGGGNPPFCKDFRRWIRESSSPIINEAQFNNFLLSEAHCSSSRIEFVPACLRDDHRIVMTHSDLHPRNLIIDNEQDVRITGVIDWEAGGGYPEYWEYIKALHTAFMEEEDNRHLFLPDAGIGTFIDEYVRDNIIGRMVS